MKTIILAIALILIGCAKNTMDVKPIPNSYQISHVCIEKNPKVKVGGFLEIVDDSFQNHRITTEQYSGPIPENCEYKLTYIAFRQYVRFYPRLTQAEIRLYKDNQRIGFAEYKMENPHTWFSSARGTTLKEKMEPLLAELLKNL